MPDIEAVADRLMMIPTTSTRHMWHEERRGGILQMLMDLEALAHRDGCIAAAWALEYICETAADK